MALDIRCLALLIAACPAVTTAKEIARTSDPCLSPDGSTILFAWQGDIWTVPSTGGMAKRLTVHPAEEAMPRWAADGKKIFFTSARFGSADVFSMSPDGTDIRRLTYESSTEYYPVPSPDGKHVYGYTNAFGRLDLFRVSSSGGDIVRLSGHPFEMEFYPAVSPDGSTFVYNSSGGAGNWRKPGQKGAATARIWTAELGVPLTGHRVVFAGDRNDLFPVFMSDSRLLFVSNRSGAPNIWSGDLDGNRLQQLTSFGGGQIRVPSYSKATNTAVFQKDSRIWTLDLQSKEARPLVIEAPEDSPRDPILETTLTSFDGRFSVSPNGKRTVIEMRGDLYLIPEKGGTTRRLTANPRYDGQPVWLDDETVLYVSAGAGGKRDLRTLTLAGASKLFLDSSEDLTCPELSPDRKLLAFHSGDRKLMVVPASGGTPVQVAAGNWSEALLGRGAFSWSPDSKWLATTSTQQRSTLVSMVSVDGKQRTEIYRAGKSASVPVFSNDARYVAFNCTEGTNYSETRNSESPMVSVELWPAPIKFSEDDLDKLDSPKAEEPSGTVRVYEPGLASRNLVSSASVAGIWPGFEGKSVFANVAGQFSTVDLSTMAVRPVTGVTGTVSSVSLSADRKKAYFAQTGKLYSLSQGAQSPSPVLFSANTRIDLAAEEEALFEEVWWSMDRLYYDETHHGKDWRNIRSDFEKIVPKVQSREDFYALMAEMMELLDSSHLGTSSPVGYRPAVTDSTAWLGVEWDWKALDSGRGFVVAKVYQGTPASHPDSQLQIGDVVKSVNGQSLAGTTMAEALNELAGRKVVLTLSRSGSERTVTILPVSSGARNDAGYEDWVDWEREQTHKLSDGMLGYIHIAGMDVPSLDTFLREIQTEMEGRKGLVVDVRYNGGGFTAHIILNIMRKEPWLIRTGRDTEFAFSENNYRGNALEMPAACLTNQYSFSNAEIFSEGFRRMKLGPVVGETTGAGVIGTSSIGLWDGGTVRVPAAGAFAIDGEDLEGNGRRPDFLVKWDPNLWMAGRDPMLEKAVHELLKKVK